MTESEIIKFIDVVCKNADVNVIEFKNGTTISAHFDFFVDTLNLKKSKQVLIKNGVSSQIRTSRLPLEVMQSILNCASTAAIPACANSGSESSKTCEKLK